MVYDARELGNYAKDFALCREAVNNTMKELAGNFIGKVEIKKTEDGRNYIEMENQKK